jgi:hypothetical protein
MPIFFKRNPDFNLFTKSNICSNLYIYKSDIKFNINIILTVNNLTLTKN